MSTSQQTLSAEAQLLLTNFRAIDPAKQGIDLTRIRPFYPKVGWHTILKPAAELEKAGLLSKKPVTNARGTLAYEVYTWVGV